MTKRKRHNNPIAGGPVEPVMQPSPLPANNNVATIGYIQVGEIKPLEPVTTVFNAEDNLLVVNMSETEIQPESVVQEKSKTNSRKGNKGNKKVAVVEEVVLLAPDEIQPGIGNTPFQITLEKGWIGNSEEGQEEDEQPKTKFLNLDEALSAEKLTEQQKTAYLRKGFNTDEEVFMGDLGASNYKEKTLANKIAELQDSPWLAEAEARKLQQELAETPVQKIQPKTKWWNPFTWFGN